MPERSLYFRIILFFDYWKERYQFIYNLDLNKYNHEANVLLWASFDALSNLWVDNIGKDQCGKSGKRIIFDAFLARYGGEQFQLVSLPDVWSRVDQGNVKVGQTKLPDDISTLLKNIGVRHTPNILEERQTRSISDDWDMDKIVDEILRNCPQTNRTQLEEWLTFSRYGSIAYKQMRSTYIHEGRSGKGTHDFKLHGYQIKPTYRSSIYATPPIIGFGVEFMLGVLKRCIYEFESDALKLEKDPAPNE
jgi:hypothetical protein